MTDSHWSTSTAEAEEYEATVAVRGNAKDLGATISTGESARNERAKKRKAKDERERAAKEQEWKERQDREREADKDKDKGKDKA